MDLHLVAATDVGIPNGVAPLNAAGVVPVNKGGTGQSSLSGLLKGAGTSGVTQAVSGVDYLVPAQLGVANGIATLDALAKLSVSQLPAEVVGAVNYQGVWNAATNTPTLASGVGVKGHYYKVSVAGSTSLDGNTLWGVNDAVVFNGTSWDRLVGSGLFPQLTVTGLSGYLVGNGTSAVTAVATIPNAGLTNSSLTLGSTSVALGATAPTVNGLILSQATLTSSLTLGASQGVAGQVLTSAGNATPTWTTPTQGTVTSVGLTVPSFLSVANSPVTAAGTLAVSYSGTALPVANGGTGVTTLSGLAFGNGTTAFTAATGAQITTAISTSPVTNASNVNSAAVTTNANFYVGMFAATSGYQSVSLNSGITVNPSTASITSGINGGSF